MTRRDALLSFEKLGAFYLGRGWDPETAASRDEPFLYDSKDLTTHGLIVGMTGSGKSGLGAVLLEEAAIDGVPALVIDPKGDMGNLKLRFPRLRAEDFAEWIDPVEAGRAGVSTEEHARETARRWREGIEAWDQRPQRIQRLVDAAEVDLYTPGSSSGRPLAVLGSLAAPPPTVRENEDALRERVLGAVSGVLGLAGIDADPVTSREHILVSSLLDRAWRAGQDQSLPELVAAVQAPPFAKLGAMDLEVFYPQRQRFDLATRLNHLLASPAFAAWREGEPIDIQRLLYTDAGRPRLSVLSIAHLTERERVFFVTLLLGEVLSWMQRQEGTGSLRALLYMDEIFGFFPPVEAPPTKRPMLSLLKQARAFGLGVVLATQNPVDLDYKGLANIGTWFLGRLQTARDRERLLEGLGGGGSGRPFERADTERLLSSLEKRVFLMHNVHESGPALFHTRWALSYLRGPMTLAQIRRLARPEGAGAPAEEAPRAKPPMTAVAKEKPRLPPGVPERFLPGSPASPGTRLYRPGLLAAATLRYVRSRSNVDHRETLHWWAPLETDGRPVWSRGEALPAAPTRAEQGRPDPGLAFAVLPDSARRVESYEPWRRSLADYLYRERRLVLLECPALGAISRPGESESEFRARLTHLARELRDEEIEALRGEYAAKLRKLEQAVRRAESKAERESSEYGASRTATLIDFGMTLAGALFGRKLGSVANARRASRAARSASRTTRERQDLERAEQALAERRRKLEKLERELAARTKELQNAAGVETYDLEARSVRPRKSELVVGELVLAWKPG